MNRKSVLEMRLDDIVKFDFDIRIFYEDLRKIVCIIHEVNILMILMDYNMEKEYFVDFLFNQIFKLLDIRIEFNLYICDDINNEFLQRWEYINKFLGDTIKSIMDGDYENENLNIDEFVCKKIKENVD